MVELPKSESGRYYLYLDESGDFNDTDAKKNGSLIGGILCYDEIQSKITAQQIISAVREKYLENYPDYERFNFYHATALPGRTPEEKEIKFNIKFDMLNAIISDRYGFIPIVFNQDSRVHIKDSTTTYIMFLVDGLVKLIQDCNLQGNFHLVVTLGGKRDIAREKAYERTHHTPPPQPFYIPGREIQNEFEKYMAMAKVREQYSFKNNFSIVFRMDDDHENELLVLSDYVSNSFLTRNHFKGELKKQYQKCAKKIHVYKISEEPNVERLKRYTADGNYSMALFYAMGIDEDTDEYKMFRENFKFAIKNMPTAEKKIVLDHYGQLLKRLLEVDRNSNEVISQINKTMAFIGSHVEYLGEYQKEFAANMRLYKLAAITHLGKIRRFQRIADSVCLPDIKASGNLELYIIYINRMIVHFQDTFNYEESLRRGGEIIDLFDAMLKPLNTFNKKNLTNFTIYNDQYFRLCGSLALTCYFTLNKSQKNLELARNCSDIAIRGFTRMADKMRQYQIRAQIEAETGEFEKACEMLDKGLNITIKNPESEQFKNFSAFDWYHFAKFIEKLLKSSDENYFTLAKKAIDISRKEFLNYRRKKTAPLKLENNSQISNSNCTSQQNLPLEYPDYITFIKMAKCFDLLDEDTSFVLELYREAIQGVEAEIGEDQENVSAISVNANAAAFRLVMLAHVLLTLEKKNMTDKAQALRNQMQNDLNEYLAKVNINSMKVPFDGWHEALEYIEKSPKDKFDILEDMSRAILL